MKKIGLCLIIIIILVIAAVILPWDKFSQKKNEILDGSNEYSSLKIYSLRGDMHIFIDGEERGVVHEEDSYFEVFPLQAGKHTVMLKRESSHEGFYKDFEREFVFEKGIDSVISWELGPTEDTSSGWLLYAKPSSHDDMSRVRTHFLCTPENCGITIDGSELKEGEDSFDLTLDSSHIINVHQEGYQTLEFEVLSEEKNAILSGYELFIEIVLYRLPI